jgi:hypothetical protein
MTETSAFLRPTLVTELGAGEAVEEGASCIQYRWPMDQEVSGTEVVLDDVLLPGR